MRRSRNFLRYTNIRQRQKSEWCGREMQAKRPILPDNLRKISAVRDLRPAQAGQASSGGIDAAVRQARPPDPLMSYFPPSCSALEGGQKAQGAVRLDAAR